MKLIQEQMIWTTLHIYLIALCCCFMYIVLFVLFYYYCFLGETSEQCVWVQPLTEKVTASSFIFIKLFVSCAGGFGFTLTGLMVSKQRSWSHMMTVLDVHVCISALFFINTQLSSLLHFLWMGNAENSEGKRCVLIAANSSYLPYWSHIRCGLQEGGCVKWIKGCLFHS